MEKLWNNLLDLFPLKFIASLFLLTLGQHSLMFLAFSILVGMDILSRWIAISYKMIGQNGQNPSLWKAFLAIPDSRRKGLIQSRVMKEQGLSKLFLYLLCVITAGMADFLARSIGETSNFTPLVIGYLTSTEALSIVENLADAGVEGLTEILEKLKSRK